MLNYAKQVQNKWYKKEASEGQLLSFLPKLINKKQIMCKVTGRERKI